MLRLRAPIIVLTASALVAVGCDPEDDPADAGPSGGSADAAAPDGGVPEDAGPGDDGGAADLGPGDAGPPDLGGPGPTPPAADVLACEAAADAYAALCTMDGRRTCHVAAYRGYCATAAGPAEAAAALDCLRTNSQSFSCRTFADPSGAEDCVEAALGPVTGAPYARIADTLRDCSAYGYLRTPFRFEPPFALLSYAQQLEVIDCVYRSASCADTARCLEEGVQAPIDACYD